MKRIQVTLDSAFLRAVDRAARRAQVNRSELVRQALREHLTKIEGQDLEARDRAGYESHPIDFNEVEVWEWEAVWPEP